MKVSAILTNKHNKNEVIVSTNSDAKSMIIPSKSSGYGSSVNGAELLLLSLATCYCNDIYREAAKRNIEISEVSVECIAEFGAEGQPGKNFRYKPVIKSNATPEQLEDLMHATDKMAEIHNTLRQGVDVILMK